MASEYSFIDIAAHDDVRERFATGDALVVLDAALSEVIWANGPGAALFDLGDIEAIIGTEPPLGAVAKRQIMAISGYPAIGRDRSLMVRMASGMSSRAVPFLASGVSLPGGEKAIMLAVPADKAASEAETAARVISGLSQPGQFVALVGKSAQILAASPGFEALGITSETLSALVAASERAPLVKKMIPAGTRRLPAGLARLTDAAHLFVVIDEEGMAEAPAALPIAETAPAMAALDTGVAPEAEVATGVPEPAEIAKTEAQAAPAETVAEAEPEQVEAALPPEPVAVEEGAAAEVPDTAQAASEPAEMAPPVERASAPIRFVWRTDADGKFSALSPEFTTAVGAEAANVIGFDFRDVCKVFGMDPDGEIAGLLERRDTWSGRSLLWPVAGTDLRVPVDLAALPVYDRNRNFEGFRGFGVARAGDAVVDPDAIGLTLVEPAERIPDLEEFGSEPLPEPSAKAPSEPAPTEPKRPDPFQGEVPALTIVPKPDRRASDKVIRLAEHRTPANDRGLTPVERNAFREIGDRLKKDSGAPAEAAKPESAAPRQEQEFAPDARKPGSMLLGTPEANTVSEPVNVEPAAGAEIEESVPATAETPPSSETTPTVATDAAVEPVEAAEAEPVAEPEVEPEAVAAKTVRPWMLGRMEADEPAAEASAVEAIAPKAAETVAEAGQPDRDPTIAAPAADSSAPPLSSIAAVLGAEGSVPGESAAKAPLFETLAAEPVLEAAGELLDEFEPVEAEAPALSTSAEEGHEADLDPVAEENGADSELEAEEDDEPDVAGDDEDAEPRRAPVDTSILDRLPIPVLIHSGDVLYYANHEFLEFTAYASVEELADRGGLGELFAEPYPPEGEDGSRKLRLRRGDELELPVEAFLQSVPWNGGKALLLSLRRINRAPLPLPSQAPAQPLKSEERQALEALITELGTIIDTATDGVILISEDGFIRSISRPAEALFGFDSADVAGKPFASLFAIESQRTAKDYVNSLSDNGVKSVLNDGREVIGREVQGRFIPLFMTIGRLPDRTGYCAVLRDITQWKRAEEDLTQARSQAERASSQKTEFLARVSHEIRTPLNAIIGFSELMMDEKFGPIGNDRYRDYLRDINRSGNHVLDLVNDLLDISKIEAGQQEMSYEAVSLNDTLSESVALMQPQANRERVIIRSSFASGLPEVVADLRTIRQIALNLLSNAIRYTPAGGQVIVSTAYETTGEVVLRFRDTGIGMSQPEIEQALKPFKQINAIKRPRGDGTGLGLPLTKAMVEANRARFTITSTPGEGTLVEITFPSTRVLAA